MAKETLEHLKKITEKLSEVIGMIKKVQKREIFEVLDDLKDDIYKIKTAPVAVATILNVIAWVFLVYYEFEKAIESGKMVVRYCWETKVFSIAVKAHECIGKAY